MTDHVLISRATLNQVIEALETRDVRLHITVAEKLRASLAAPCEPVAWCDEEMEFSYTRNELDDGTELGLIPLYAAPKEPT